MRTRRVGRRRGSLWTYAACAILLTSAGTAHARQPTRLDVNVGYPPHEGPVPSTAACLGPQEVFNAIVAVQVGAAAEPTIAVNPKNENHIVTSWQQDRITDGGALEAGIAYSKDGGRTWQRTTVPFQACLGGATQRTSDVWLSYALDGSRLYLTALLINATADPSTSTQSGIVVTTSQDDGATWSIPHFVAESQNFLNEPTGRFPFDDKNSVTADRNDPLKAYAVWDRSPQTMSSHSTTQISRTLDGGKTWSPPRTLYDPFPDLVDTHRSNGIEDDSATIDNIVVVQPKVDGSNDHDAGLRLNGDLLNFMVRIYASPTAPRAQSQNDPFPFPDTLFDIDVVRSQDHGVSWDTRAVVITPFSPALVFTGGYTYSGNEVTGGVGTLLRSGEQTPSATINPRNGFLYVAHQSNVLRPDRLPQVGISTSRDGGRSWSLLAKVSRTPAGARNAQAFNPFVAVTESGRVGIVYFDFRHDDTSDPDNTKTDAWLAIYQEVDDPRGGSTGVGLDFVKEVRLSRNSFVAQNGPITTAGVMTTGDYPFVVAHADHFYAIYTKSTTAPFTPPAIFLSDPAENATILLDDNYRQAPFVSVIAED